MIIAIPGTPPGIDPDTQSAPQMWTIGAQLYGESGMRWSHATYSASQSIANPNKVPGFWIADTDIQSKYTFAVIMLLFSIADTGVKGSAPVVTIPANQ